ncbi:conserved hypothetical protein [Gloeothece citriformis PCC 7424]|uniref:DDE transposase family protein n=1 Tax=Gloeothece citriformis (strain PCC 7424) TaxID=65393 RepID=B7KFQ4_GLOC7|nr:hypothetical protein [Gloeothece citriformis]ACK73379.1 conserved hypothetical protein [Gloeothece citriformis PCC 7424]
MISPQNWYIVKTEDGFCEIINLPEAETPVGKKYWGPFKSESEAIAHRVGLIRGGKCQPR